MTNRFLSITAIAAVLGSTCFAKTIKVEWYVPNSGQVLPDMTAEVGDRAVFEWGSTHNVLIHPTGDCTEDGAIPVGAETGASYRFTAEDIGDVVFSCDIGNHCENGQIITFAVSEAAPTDAPTDAPAPASTSAPTSDAFGVSVFAGLIAAQIMTTQMLM